MNEPNQPKHRTTFYVTKQVWKDFKTILFREGESASSKIEGWVQHYVMLHKRGNPQLMIETFLPEKAEPRVLCSWLDGLRQGEVHCRKKGVWLDAKNCYSCKLNRLRRRRTKK